MHAYSWGRTAAAAAFAAAIAGAALGSSALAGAALGSSEEVAHLTLNLALALTPTHNPNP